MPACGQTRPLVDSIRRKAIRHPGTARHALLIPLQITGKTAFVTGTPLPDPSRRPRPPNRRLPRPGRRGVRIFDATPFKFQIREPDQGWRVFGTQIGRVTVGGRRRLDVAGAGRQHSQVVGPGKGLRIQGMGFAVAGQGRFEQAMGLVETTQFPVGLCLRDDAPGFVGEQRVEIGPPGFELTGERRLQAGQIGMRDVRTGRRGLVRAGRAGQEKRREQDERDYLECGSP